MKRPSPTDIAFSMAMMFVGNAAMAQPAGAAADTSDQDLEIVHTEARSPLGHFMHNLFPTGQERRERIAERAENSIRLTSSDMPATPADGMRKHPRRLKR